MLQALMTADTFKMNRYCQVYHSFKDSLKSTQEKKMVDQHLCTSSKDLNDITTWGQVMPKPEIFFELVPLLTVILTTLKNRVFSQRI